MRYDIHSYMGILSQSSKIPQNVTAKKKVWKFIYISETIIKDRSKNKLNNGFNRHIRS